MRTLQFHAKSIVGLLALSALPARVLGGDILKTSGFTTCLDKSAITVDKLNVQYDRAGNTVTFDVSGSSAKEQNVTASLIVTAYGKQVYQKNFDPCAEDTKVQQLCPVPSGNFAAKGSQNIPSNYASMIPSIAFSVPDLDGAAKLQLKAADGGQDLACIQSNVNNGRTVEVPAVSYIAAGVAGAALLLTGVSALGSVGATGASTPSPSFSDVIGWFQSMAMNGMLSVNYPPVYRSFTKNFAFSGGLIPWDQMQTTIDSFRKATGGNLTEDSVAYLRNSTLVYSDGSSSNSSGKMKRGIEFFFDGVFIETRDVSTEINGTQSGIKSGNSTGEPTDNKVSHLVHGIQGYVEQLTIPQANTFMTVLLIFAIVVAAIAVGILLFKVILETWALFGSFPNRLTSFRKRYWGLLARTITNLILLLYGIWTLYCVYQFTHGDSWAAKALAGVTFAIFTAVLGFFTFRILQLAQKYKELEGDASALFEDKETWVKYSLFYDTYKKGYWWLFMPAIVYMFAKGCVLAAGDGHGLAQTAGQLIIESLMLLLLLWNRPYATKAGNWINAFIQGVRVLSVVCILVFVEQLGISQSTKTITGVVLIAVQSVLTGSLAILIAVNSIIVCCKENPHRKRRKEAEKMNRDLDNLTPLDARNSLLMDPSEYKESRLKAPLVSGYPMSTVSSHTSYDRIPNYRDQTPPPRRFGPGESTENLVSSAASIEERHHRSTSRESDGVSPPPVGRQPTVPNMGYRGMAY
ncbi:MAG: hypothetical protein M1830_010682 [Pleopsidium flavum]|nr:MAG: hypothetical protein M1830_010682 [Pleopsidium flavum]